MDSVKSPDSLIVDEMKPVSVGLREVVLFEREHGRALEREEVKLPRRVREDLGAGRRHQPDGPDVVGLTAHLLDAVTRQRPDAQPAMPGERRQRDGHERDPEYPQHGVLHIAPHREAVQEAQCQDEQRDQVMEQAPGSIVEPQHGAKARNHHMDPQDRDRHPPEPQVARAGSGPQQAPIAAAASEEHRVGQQQRQRDERHRLVETEQHVHPERALDAGEPRRDDVLERERGEADQSRVRAEREPEAVVGGTVQRGGETERRAQREHAHWAAPAPPVANDDD